MIVGEMEEPKTSGLVLKSWKTLWVFEALVSQGGCVCGHTFCLLLALSFSDV